MSENLSIYVADLHAYNCGELQGEWLDLDFLDSDEIRERIQELLDKWGVEEFTVHDYEGFPSFFGEYPNLDDLSTYAKACSDHGKRVVDAFLKLREFSDLDDLKESYLGAYDSKEDYAQEYLEDCGYLDHVNACLRPYIDLESFIRDLELGGDVSSVFLGLKFYFFRNY